MKSIFTAFHIAACTLLLCAHSASAQLKKPSATEFTEEQKTYITGHREGIKMFDDSTARAVIEIPVKVHIVRKSDGTGNVTFNDVDTALTHLNEQFLPIYIRFIALPDFNYLNSDYFYQFDKTKEEELCLKNEVPKTINLFVVGTIKNAPEDKGTFNAYTYPPSNRPKDRLFIASKNLRDKVSLVRQMGHYLALYPTHGTHPTDRTEELVNGRNCTTTGDEICDTPADPRLTGQLVDGRCEYSGTLEDGEKKYYRPLIDNFMSDNPRTACVERFTRQQYARMLYAATNMRNYLAFPKIALTKKQLKAMEENYGINGESILLVNGQSINASQLDRNTFLLPNISVGSQLRLQITNHRKAYIYVLEGNATRGATLVYPQKGDKLFFEDQSITFSAPANDKNFTINDKTKSTNHICILFSKEQLNIQDYLKKINNAPNTSLNLLQRIYYVLGHNIVATNDLLYESKGNQFKVSGLTAERTIVPIFIQFQTQ